MDPQSRPSMTTLGTGRSVYGDGSEGTCGHVELTLDVFPKAEPSAEVRWAAPAGPVPDEAAGEIVAYHRWYLDAAGRPGRKPLIQRAASLAVIPATCRPWNRAIASSFSLGIRLPSAPARVVAP